MTKIVTGSMVVHPMVKFQRQVQSMVNRSKSIRPQDPLWKIAFLFGDEWAHLRKELEDFDFSMQDPIADFLAVETWEED